MKRCEEKRLIKLHQYMREKKESIPKKIKAISLFSNVGIAEAYFKQIGIDVVLANEIDSKRVNFYKHLYPNVEVIKGDITSLNIEKEILAKAKINEIELLIATPPCQGMSTAGKKEESDPRNNLICHAIKIVKKLKPKYIFLENVPTQLTTKITYKSKIITILEYLKKELGSNYNFNDKFVVNAGDYGVPQDRKRAIILLVRKDLGFKWDFPVKNNYKINLDKAIGKLPILDPDIADISENEKLNIFPNFYERKETASKISRWFYPPKHVFRQVYSLMYTPSGKSAFENIDLFRPRKTDGSLTKGFKNTYKRQNWDKPAYTVTMYNRTISSQDNVHPGRYLGKDKQGYPIYSDARVLTIYELMIVSSLPKDWDIPDWATDHFIRQVIGEGIPPLLVKKIMLELIKVHNE